MTPYSLLLEKLHFGKDPYAGFPSGWQGTWFGDPGAQRAIFGKAIEATNPALIIEVGSFVGESSIHMANIVRAQGRSCAILCIDTWCFGYDHWLGAPEKIKMHFGRADLYYKWVANVIGAEAQNVILPFAMDSINAARVLKWMGIVPQLIYVDASHEQGDVYRDYVAYWDLLAPGGGMLVDDLSNHFPGVVADWVKFTEVYGLTPTLTEGEKALVIKTLALKT